MTDLSSTSPDTLTALFLSDPLTHTPADHEALVRELRRRRSEFLSSEAAKSLAPPRAKVQRAASTASSAVALDKPTDEIELGDLL